MAKKKADHIKLEVTLILLILVVGSAIVFLTQEGGLSGAATGMAKVTVQCFVAMSVPNSEVDFGVIFPGSTDDTTDDSPAPLLVQNDGVARINVTIAREASSTPMFSGTGGGDNTASFQFKVDEGSETGSFNFAASTTSFTNVPGTTPTLAVAFLNYTDSEDSAEIDLKIDVPSDEPPGDKNETLELIASLADDTCGVPSGGGGNSCITFDFDQSDNGTGMRPGRIIDVEYSDYNLTISANNYDGPDKAITFNSSNPSGGDDDLGTPNEDFGGPGMGTGGETGETGENNAPYKNLLIIPKDIDDNNNDGYVDDPNDDNDGGKFYFDFSPAKNIENITLVDVDESGWDIRIKYSNLSTKTINVPTLGDNSIQTIEINENDVIQVRVDTDDDSGAVAQLTTCNP